VRLAGAHLGLAALFALLSAGPLRAEESCEGVPPSVCAAFRTAVELREQGKFGDSLARFEVLRREHPGSFPIQYAYGRLLAQMRLYPEAIVQLEATAKLGPATPGFDPGIYNTLGFALLMDTQYEKALEWFGALEKSEHFSGQPKELRTKLYNNSGVAYLQLDRYREAQEQFEKAKELGSQVARNNLVKIASILETLASGDVDVPGVFAVIVASARNEAAAAQQLSNVALKLGVAPSAFGVFLASNGRYLVARASYVSYPKAQLLAEESRKKGIRDAFIGSTTEWTDISARFETAKR
jgi:tetratricopeptide (TPR) repeat protein